MAADDATAFPPGLVFEHACSYGDLLAKQRILVRLSNGRGILVLLHKGKVFACDHLCYHHGGPLEHAEIEDLGGTACIVCPWHKYKISIESGQGVYIGIDIATKQQEIKSKGAKQRVHFVRVVRDDVQVADSSTFALPEHASVATAVGTSKYPSDEYSFMPFLSGSEPAPDLGPKLPLHSSASSR